MIAWDVVSLWIRMILYFFLAYSILSLVVISKSKESKVRWLHVIVALFFVTIGTITVLSVLGYNQFERTIRTYAFTPLLIILSAILWKHMLDNEKREVKEKCRKREKKSLDEPIADVPTTTWR